MENRIETEKARRFFAGISIVLLIGAFLSGCVSHYVSGIYNDLSAESTEGNVKMTKANAVPEEEYEETGRHVKLSVTDPGFDIFTPSKWLGADYRYGPSLLLNEDGSVDAWFSAPGDGNTELDWISYRHSEDGNSFSEEKIVLTPTPGSLDALSVCDPDVFYFDGYYYLGYTSTIDSTNKGICNSVFLARAKDPAGPYEKWDGKGFGGDPVPIICYDGVRIGWGIGEPSFVILDNTLYVYVTRDSFLTDYTWIRTTEVYTADLSEKNWPAEFAYRGDAAVRTDGDQQGYVYDDCDSWDAAYVEEADMFVAVCVNRRFKSDSSLLYFESEDGISFNRVAELNTNVICGANNSGFMSDGKGHIKSGDKGMIGYAYSGSESSAWGVWALRMAPVTIEPVERADRSDEGKENLKLPFSSAGKSGGGPVMINADAPLNSKNLDEAPFKQSFYYLDADYSKHYIDKSEINISGYSEETAAFKDGVMWGRSTGSTKARLEYKGLSREIRFSVMAPGEKGDEYKEMFTVKDEYRITLYQPYAVVIRPLVRLSDHSVYELTDEDIISEGVTYSCDDTDIIDLWIDGTVYPKAPGTATVRISSESGLSCTAKVVVLEPSGE